jgi:TatD DNase family protein
MDNHRFARLIRSGNMSSKALPGIITFKSAGDLREVAKKVPLDRILVETDAPYLTPVPYRGKPNSPAYTYYTAEKLADIID